MLRSKGAEDAGSFLGIKVISVLKERKCLGRDLTAGGDDMEDMISMKKE